MPNICWRCENGQGDVKYAAREAHVQILEDAGYTCVLDEDLDLETLNIFDISGENGTA